MKKEIEEGFDNDPICQTDLFKKLKMQIGAIQFNWLAMNSTGTAIEANPSTHRIAKHVYSLLTPSADVYERAKEVGRNDSWGRHLTHDDLISIIRKVSLLDLSDCEFEEGIEQHMFYVNVINHGVIVDAISWDGNIFRVMNNDGSMDVLNPQYPALVHAGLLAGASSGMQWVKAAIRKPDGIRVSVKYKGNYNVIYKTVDGYAFDDNEGMRVLPEDWDDIYWLDEASPSSMQEENERLQRGILRIHEMCILGNNDLKKINDICHEALTKQQ